MATTGDIRDIMNLGHDGPRQPAPKKKKKYLEAQPRLSGISREVQALMGDSVPPVAIVEAPKYKQKPSVTMKMFKPRHWEERTFVHGARKDGLKLKHWKRSVPGSTIHATPVSNGETLDTDMIDGNEEAAAVVEVRYEDEFPSEKWNVEVQVQKYDSEQYEKSFKSEEWTKEETDYLMQLCQDYDLRWLLIADRYDPADILPVSDEDTASRVIYPQRRMEDLKERYYTIAAKLLELQTPASNMAQTEFQLWEKMRNFDARAELQRKAMAEKLFERTKEEADEEKVLLEELYRITKNEDDFIKMRKELYSRLETAPSLRRNDRGEEPSTALYQTSQGLSMLLSSLLAKEKRLKPRVPPSGTEAASAAQTPTDAQRPRHGHQYSRRETMDSTAGDDNAPPSKKGSVSQAPVVRTLTSAEEVKFGVSHPQERLTSGVMFRHEKINRLTMAKSQVQTQKIGAALTELGIPPRLLMPTERVCREFERLVSEVQILLDTRRVLEKVSSEVKVLEEHKRLRLGGDPVASELKSEADVVDTMELDNTATSSRQQDEARSSTTARAGVQGAGAAQLKTSGGSNNRNASGTLATEDNTTIDVQDRDDAEVEDSQVQADNEDEDEDNDVDQSAMADDDEDADDVNRSYGRVDNEDDEEAADQDDEEDEENETNVLEEEDDEDDDDDDAPGLEDLERANQVTDDEDEEDEDDNDNEVDQSQFAEDDDDEQGEDGNEEDAAGEEEAEVDESMLNGADEDEQDEQDEADEEDEQEEEESRPASSHSNARVHKRSASVMSEASRAESSRSGASRKRRK